MCGLYDANTGVTFVLFMNPISARGCSFSLFVKSKEANGISSVVMIDFLPRETLYFTYQVAHVLLWFGNVELHLVFNQELESQVVLGGVQLMGLRDESRCWSHRVENNNHLYFPPLVCEILRNCILAESRHLADALQDAQHRLARLDDGQHRLVVWQTHPGGGEVVGDPHVAVRTRPREAFYCSVLAFLREK